MYEYKIEADKELADILNAAAKRADMSAEQFILQILNKYLVAVHMIDHEAMAAGYEEMGELNLELSK